MTGPTWGSQIAFLYAVRDGLIARADLVPDRDAALAAAAEAHG